MCVYSQVGGIQVGVNKQLGEDRRMRIGIARVLLLIAFGLGNLAAQSDPSLTPAARKWREGPEARKANLLKLRAKLKEFTDRPESKSAGRVPPALSCPVALETSLLIAALEGHESADEGEEFHLIVRVRNENQYLDVLYAYNQRRALLGTGVARLQAEGVVGFQPGEAHFNKFIVTTDKEFGCIFEFDSADPFASKAVASQPE
jgi:hypothetical protein